VLVDLSPRALREATRIARWWRANRPTAPFLFDEELRHAMSQIATAPYSGVVVPGKGGQEYRRLLMPATRCYIFWRNESPRHARVAAIWSALRRAGPAL
jgi:plasmid stabilization system protein ParE